MVVKRLHHLTEFSGKSDLAITLVISILRQVPHTPSPEIWHEQLHMYFSGLKGNLCSYSHLKSQALNFGTRSMKYIVHGFSYVDIIENSTVSKLSKVSRILSNRSKVSGCCATSISYSRVN